VREQNGGIKLVNDPDLQADAVEQAKWSLDDYCDLRGNADRPQRGEDYIENLVRGGEVLLICSSSKYGKSWLLGCLIWSAVCGTSWLGRQVRQGKVLLIDNELQRGEIDWRHAQICEKMNHKPQPEELKVFCRRGQPCDIQAIDLQLSLLDWDWSEYSLIVIDAIYKTIPDGKSENDNEAMAKLMNVLQGIAERTGVPVVGVHHATKGGQGQKAALDVFAGAGAFGRALDNAVVVREHGEPELSVIDFISRTHPPQDQQSAKFDWPIWSLVTVQPAVKKPGRSAAALAQNDREADEAIRQAFESKPGKKLSESQLVRIANMGPSRIRRAVGRALKKGVLKTARVQRSGKKVEVFRLNATASAT
jgi:hypothetical protein